MIKRFLKRFYPCLGSEVDPHHACVTEIIELHQEYSNCLEHSILYYIPLDVALLFWIFGALRALMRYSV